MKIDKISDALDKYYAHQNRLRGLEKIRSLLSMRGAQLSVRIRLKGGPSVDVTEEIMGEQWLHETLLAAIEELTLKKAKLKRRLEAASDVIDGKGE